MRKDQLRSMRFLARSAGCGGTVEDAPSRCALVRLHDDATPPGNSALITRKADQDAARYIARATIRTASATRRSIS